MNDLFKPTDFTLNGKDSYISQRATARLIGTSHQNIGNWLTTADFASVKVNENNQIHVKSLGLLLKLCQQKASVNKDLVDDLITDILTAGAVTFVYTLAGEKFITASDAEARTKQALRTIQSQLTLAEQQIKLNGLLAEAKSIEMQTVAIQKQTEFISSDNAASLSVIIDERGLNTSAVALNETLRQHKLLTRNIPSIVTHKGFQFGTNFNTGSSKQARWYRHTFSDLLTFINYKD